ncbi:hypothetical protein KC19_4G131100 [Ceratodon purpureus]|uniref:Uncharacterized protein n=1 Tax=Ceratodon purpureus TaxID=3225 RepID=A0A8T0IAQ8_CERPU|nr:hypothetical protein KC19_4G131100 [Ceratodon purpureus]
MSSLLIDTKPESLPKMTDKKPLICTVQFTTIRCTDMCFTPSKEHPIDHRWCEGCVTQILQFQLVCYTIASLLKITSNSMLQEDFILNTVLSLTNVAYPA